MFAGAFEGRTWRVGFRVPDSVSSGFALGPVEAGAGQFSANIEDGIPVPRIGADAVGKWET